MSIESEVAQLQQELAELKNNFREYGAIHQHDIGQAEAYRAAITAIIAAHPDPNLLAVHLNQHLSRPEAREVFQSNNDERLQGLQEAQSYLLEVVGIAQRLHRTPG
jgi:hypothetical protein